jgi:hypothetical protein
MYELGSVSVHAFEHDPKIVYHMDKFRNVSRDFNPFNYPSFEQVLGGGYGRIGSIEILFRQRHSPQSKKHAEP